jgi:predicted MPP superfamily phosphohydrolase
MFGTVLTVGYTVLLAHIFWRASSVAWISRHLSRKALMALAAGLWSLFVVGRMLGHDGQGAVAIALETVGMALLGMVFLHSMMLLLVELVTLFGHVLSRWAGVLRGWGLLAGTVLSVIALIQGFRAPAVVAYEVTLPSLPAELDGRVVVGISDAHFGTQLGAEWFAARMAQIQALRPDVVVFLGDIFEGHGGAYPDLPSLTELSAPLGKWFVVGNHESHGQDDAGVAVLERAGFRRLSNQSATLAPGLVLTGVNDLTNHRRRHLDGDPLGSALASRPRGASVLLSHTPWQSERAASAGVELMLSGHTHGGQIWPFQYLVQKTYPLVAGRYDILGMPVIVCRGTGTWGPRMRLWHRGEILKVTLHAAQAREFRTGEGGAGSS